MPIIEERIGHVRAEGDLSENAEYHGARESQGLLQARIDLLNDKLARATIVNTTHVAKDVVGFGCTVQVRDLDLDKEEEFTLVGGGEEDYASGKILVTSPLAQGMVGKRVGDKVEIQVPMGTSRLRDPLDPFRRRLALLAPSPSCRLSIYGLRKNKLIKFCGAGVSPAPKKAGETPAPQPTIDQVIDARRFSVGWAPPPL